MDGLFGLITATCSSRSQTFPRQKPRSTTLQRWRKPLSLHRPQPNSLRGYRRGSHRRHAAFHSKEGNPSKPGSHM